MAIDKDYNIMLGLRIREFREARQQSREEFSELCDISASFLTDIERGKKSPTARTLHKICKAAHISADYIVQGNGNTFEADVLIELIRPLTPENQAHAVNILSEFIKAINNSRK